MENSEKQIIAGVIARLQMASNSGEIREAEENLWLLLGLTKDQIESLYSDWEPPKNNDPWALDIAKMAVERHPELYPLFEQFLD